jgi:hypothetical protein
MNLLQDPFSLISITRFQDAVEHLPRTTLQGLFDKAADARAGGSARAAEFECPERLYGLLAADESTRRIPVSFHLLTVWVCYFQECLI